MAEEGAPPANPPGASPGSPRPSSFPCRYPSSAAPSGLVDPGRAKDELYLKSYHYSPWVIISFTL